MRFLTPGEVGALLATAAAAGDRLAALWALAVYTGARQGELLALRWSDVDLDDGTLTISRALERIRGGAGVYAEPKTATSLRSLTVEADAVALLLAHRERQLEEKRVAGGAYADEGLIFCTQLGRPLSRFNVTRDLKLALRRAGLAPVRFHDLRHTSATLMLIAGVHLKQMGARLGHADISSGGSTARRPGAWSGPSAPAARRGPGRPGPASRGAAGRCAPPRPATSDSRKGSCEGSRRQTARLRTPGRAVSTWKTWSGREDLNLRPPEPH
jgi:hypothetical protein